MIIQGPMGLVADRASGTKEAEWIGVETAQAADIPKGALCAWDVAADNSAVAGILQNTWGLRVIVYPTAEAGDVADGKNRVAGVANKLIPGYAGFASGRSPICLLQIYGHRSDLMADTDGNSNIIVGGIIQPSGDAAGKFEGPQTETAVALPADVLKVCGFSFEAVAVNTTTTFNGFLKIR